VLREDRPQGECLAAYPLRVQPEDPSDPVLDALDGAPTTPDTLAQRTGLTLDALSAKLLTLELDGRIASLPGGRYQKIH
jgi:DNA processing protein